MKTLKQPLFFYAALLAVLIFSRCTFPEDLKMITDSVDSLQVMVSTPRFNTGVNIAFVDAKTKQLINSKPISVSVNGKDAGFVYNDIGGKESPYIRTWGMLDLIIDPHTIDSTTIKDNPLYFNISANIDGYIQTDNEISISEIGKKRVIVEMINKQIPPEGIIINEYENLFETGSDGEVEEDIFIDIPSDSNQNSGIQMFSEDPIQKSGNLRNSLSLSNDKAISIKIPKGIIFKNYKGETLVGKASVELHYSLFSADNKSSLTPYKAVGNNNDGVNSVWLYPFSFLNLSIYIKNGNTSYGVYKTEKGEIGYTFSIPSTFYNREKNKVAAENDIIERRNFYSDENWIQKVKIYNDTIKKIDGKLCLNGKLNMHYWSTWGYVKPFCMKWPLFNFVGNFKTNPNFLIDIYSDDYKIDSYDGAGVIYNETKRVVGIDRLPSGSVKYIYSKSEQNEDVVLEYSPSEIINNCEGKEYNISVKETIKPGVEFIKLNFDLTVASPTSQVAFKPNLGMYVNKENSNLIPNQHELINGKATISVVLGSKYKIWMGFYSWMGDARLLVENEGADKFKVTVTTMKFTTDGNSKFDDEFIFLPKKNADGSIDIKYNAVIPEDIFSTLGF